MRHKKGMRNFTPRSFTTNAGVYVETRPHFATFNGRQNASKCKVLLVLYDWQSNKLKTTGLSIRELHKLSGVSYDYIKVKVTRWVKWGYLERLVRVANVNRPIFVYKIAKRGKHLIGDILPKEWRDHYIAEINEFISNNDKKDSKGY